MIGASRYFADRFYAPRYFPKTGATTVDPPLGGASDVIAYTKFQPVIVCGSLFGGLQAFWERWMK